jgi:AcrR family transcriptional regulator
MIEDAALAVMRRNAYEDISVGDILREAQLSTRSFYRHFRSKDDLVLAMYRRNAEAAAERLAVRSGRPGPPAARLEAWIEEILSFRYDRRKAERMALLGSPGVRRAAGYLDEERNARALLVGPLVEVLRAGLEEAAFTTVDPVRDAFTVLAIVFDALEWVGRTDPRPSAADALAHCLRFVMGGLGD